MTVAEVDRRIAALSLQGPCSASVLEAAGFDVCGAEAVPDDDPARSAAGELTISRTGFTGDLGYELWTTPDHALPLWDRLFEAGAPWGIRPIGTRRA